MAKKDKVQFNYAAELKRLKEQGPERLYYLCGPEDYLRECYLTELRQLCVASGDEFAYRRLDGPNVDLSELAEAVDALPFFSERSFVEVRDCDLSKCRESECERLKKIINDIPDYCTLVFTFSAATEPDGRLAAVKAIKKVGRTVEFAEQEQAALTRWVQNRFRSLQKSISPADAEYLIFLSGTRMSRLIPEIEKAASYAGAEQVSRADIEATANRIPEADVFTMITLISKRRFDEAAALLGDLMADKNNHPIYLNALIGQQFRQLYAAKTARLAGRSRSDIMELCGIRYDFIYDRLAAAAGAYPEQQLALLVKLCAEYDYRMKSTGQQPQTLLKELFARIAAGE